LDTSTKQGGRQNLKAGAVAKPSALPRETVSAPPRFKTVLMPNFGWPTDASVVPPRRRNAKR
jgi:hypothetical protein